MSSAELLILSGSPQQGLFALCVEQVQRARIQAQLDRVAGVHLHLRVHPPDITVIAENPAAIGRTAAEVLFRRLDGDRSPSEHNVVQTRMITRGSGKIPP